MRCSEVRTRIEAALADREAPAWDEEVEEHLRSCKACFQFARAETALAADLAAAAPDDLAGGISFASLRTHIEARVNSTAKLENIMSKIKETCRSRPALFAGLGFTVMVVAFAGLVPLPYEEVVGYRIAFAEDSPGSGNSSGLCAAAISAVAPSEIWVDSVSDESSETVRVIKVPKSAEVGDLPYLSVVVSPQGSHFEVEPVREAVSRSLMARLLARMGGRKAAIESLEKPPDSARVKVKSLRALLHSVDVTDDEVAEQIRRLLADLGVSDSVGIAVYTDTDAGDRMITLYAAEDKGEVFEGTVLELVISNGDIYATRSAKASLSAKEGFPDSLSGEIMIRVKLEEEDD